MLFAYLYLIRVPLICGALIAFLRYSALTDTGSATELLAGLFDVSWQGSLLIGSCAAWFTAACVVNADVMITYTHDRFDAPPVPAWFGAKASDAWLWVQRREPMKYEWLQHFWQWLVEDLSYQTFILIAVYLALSLWLLSGLVVEASLASGVTALLSYLVTYLALWVLYRGWGGGSGILNRPPPFTRRIIERLTGWTPRGYTLTEAGERDDAMEGYHAGALMSMLVSFGFYFFIYILIRRGWLVPSLACVLLLTTSLCWLLSGITFLTDRFRVPVVALALLVFAYTGSWPEADHTFEIFNSHPNLPTVQQLAAIEPQRFIAVAASGGGIHAAGWTTHVLGGLYTELPAILRARFAQSIRVISPVSGGSVGTLYLLNAYLHDNFRNGTFTPQQIETFLYRPSVESSLDPMVQRLVYEDWWRTLAPGIPLSADRGRAAEEAWQAAAPDALGRQWLGRSLGDWAALVAQRTVPAVFFNSTIVDTGERAVLATAAFSETKSGRRVFSEELYNRPVDVSLLTAARLSATFPVVSPSARAAGLWPRSYRYHFVDGGYYDNYGIATLVEWLDDAFTAAPNRPNVLLLQIRDSPESQSPRPALGDAGFLSQALAPLFTIFRFRDSGQVAHGNLEAKLLSRSWGGRIEPVKFAWPRESAPLSWHLTENDKRDLSRAFDDPGLLESKRQVCLFLADQNTELARQCTSLFRGHH